MAWCCIAWPIIGHCAQPRGRRRLLVEPGAVGNRSGDGLEVRAGPDNLVQQRVRAGDATTRLTAMLGCLSGLRVTISLAWGREKVTS